MDHRMWYPLADPHGGMAITVEGPGGVGLLARRLDDAHADRLCAEHNAAVTALRERPAVGDLEAFARRVLAGALRELIRDALSRRRKRAYTRRG